MFTICGTTGQVGGAAARALLGAGHEVRAQLRDPARLPADLADATVAVADLDDADALATAFEGIRGCFVLLPFDPVGERIEERQERMTRVIADAVARAGVPHAVVLSSLGAEDPDATPILARLHDLEQSLRGTGAVISTLRCTYFQEKVAEVLPAALEGVYPVFGDDVDTPVSMVATADIGAVVAATLLDPPPAHQVVDVLGPHHSEREVSIALGRQLGRELAVERVPRRAWEESLVQSGLSTEAAGLLSGLYDASLAGDLRPVGDRQVVGATPLETTLSRLVSADAETGYVASSSIRG